MKDFKYELRQEVWFENSGKIKSFVIQQCCLRCKTGQGYEKFYIPFDSTKPWSILEEYLYHSEKECIEAMIFNLQNKL